MARTFDSVDDSIGVGVGGLSAQTTAGTYVAVMRRNSNGFLSQALAIFAGGSRIAELAIVNTSNLLRLRAGTSANSTFTVTVADGWVLVAVTKAAGTVAPRMHRYVYGTDSWTHENGSATVADVGPGATTNFLGTSADSDLAAVGIWSRVLPDAEIELLAHSLNAWVLSNPNGMWVFDQSSVAQPVMDWSGNGGQQTSITGTALAASSAPIGYGAPVIVIPHVSVSADVGPGPIAIPATLPAPGVSAGVTREPAPIGVPAAVPTPSVFTGGAVTPVEPLAIPVPATLPTPAVSTVKNATVAPAPIAVAAFVPIPTVVVPTNPGDHLTRHGQVEYNGFVMGPGTPYRVRRIIGIPWDMPPLDSGDVPHPSAHGALTGQKLSQSRIVTVEMQIEAPIGAGAGDTTAIEEAAAAFLARLPVPQADEQLGIAVQVLSRIWVGTGVCTNRAAPIDQLTEQGFIAASAQFTMNDPRFYGRELLSAEIADGGHVEVFNAGNTDSFPILRCPGPATGPLLEISWLLPSGAEAVRTIEYNVTIPTGQALIIDVKRGTALMAGESQARHRVTGSVSIPDMMVPTGISTIAYETSGGAAPPAVALWKHAHL